MESCAPVPCDEYAPAHLPVNPDQDTSCRYSQRSDGGVLIEGAAYPIADGGEERAFFGFEDTAEDSRDYMREVPDGADGFKRLVDAALAASCATLSPNTADPCLVARLAAESRERSRSLTDPGTQARGAKRAAGSSAQDGAAGRGPAL